MACLRGTLLPAVFVSLTASGVDLIGSQKRSGAADFELVRLLRAIGDLASPDAKRHTRRRHKHQDHHSIGSSINIICKLVGDR